MERPRLKIGIRHLKTPTLQGFMGTVHDENGNPIKESFDICRTWLIQSLGAYATWYIDNMIMEKENDIPNTNQNEE